MIDTELLEKIINEVALKRLAAEFREMIVYSGNKEICEIYQRYMDESLNKGKSKYSDIVSDGGMDPRN